MAHYHTVHLGKEFDDARVEMDEIGDKTGPSWSNPLQGERASILEVSICAEQVIPSLLNTLLFRSRRQLLGIQE